jgi:hypothetical protein
MANTFKVKTDAAAPASAGNFDTIYTAPSSTTAIVLGLMVCNVKDSQVTASVRLNTNTVDVETNQPVLLVQDVPIPVGSSVELLAGNKVVLQTTDFLEIDCDTTAGVDVTLSIMEIT